MIIIPKIIYLFILPSRWEGEEEEEEEEGGGVL